jgi:hypothetical protein
MASQQTVFGLVEMADLLDVGHKTPHAWLRRGLLPPPDHDSVNSNKAWNRDTIIAWAARTGRLPDDLADEGAEYLDGRRLPAYRGGRSAKAEFGVPRD